MPRLTTQLLAAVAFASCVGAQTPLKFMGRDVTITDPGTEDPDGFFPQAPYPRRGEARDPRSAQTG